MHNTAADRIKWSLVTHRVPTDACVRWEKRPDDPRVGDLALVRVVSLGRHTRLDSRDRHVMNLFPGDRIACSFGNRYATDQYEGYVPPRVELCHILSIGGVCGMVGSKNERMPDPTVVRFEGYGTGGDGRILNLRDFRLKPLPPREGARPPKVLVSIGASMNSGKTTTAAMAIRGLVNAGTRVCAAKLTGTGAAKDVQHLRDAGAERVLDFTDYGCPSTYRASLRKLLRLERTLRSHLSVDAPEVLVYEIADGIFQRETALLLQSAEFRSGVDAVIFSAVDSMSAESGKRAVEGMGYRLIGFSGIVSASELGKIEVERATGLPCLSSRELSEGLVVPLLQGRKIRRRRGGSTTAAPPATLDAGTFPDQSSGGRTLM